MQKRETETSVETYGKKHNIVCCEAIMKKGHVFGIDIGSSCIKVFAGRVVSTGHIDIVGHGVAPSSGFSKGVLMDAKAMATAVKEAVDCVQIASSLPFGPAYVGVGGTAIHALNCKGRIAPTNITSITQADVNRACRAASLTAIPDSHRLLHISPINYWLDGRDVGDQPLGLKGKCLEAQVHAITVSKLFYDDVIGSLESVGINVAAMVANTMMNTLSIPPDPTQCSLIMDMGAGTTDVVLYRNNKICYTASLPFGDHYVTNDIILGLGVSQAHAEGIKRYYARLNKELVGRNVVLDCNDYGTTDKHIPYDFLHKIVESRVEEIVTLVYNEVRPVIADVAVNNIVLTGACTAMPSIAAQVERIFGVAVQIAEIGDVAPEYSNLANCACYGIIQYAAGQLPVLQEPNESHWQSLWGKIKNMF